MKSARITRTGNAILVTSGDGGALHRDTYAPLLPFMSYVHITHLRGRAAWVTGTHIPISTEVRRLYSITDEGILTCPAGYRDRVYTSLKAAGYFVEMYDDPPRRRPGVLVADRRRLYDLFLSKVDLRYRQDECLDAAISRIERGLGGCVKAVAGYGKSFLVAALATAFPKARVAVAVPGVDVLRKTADECAVYIPSVGVVGDGEKTFARVTCYSMQSIHHLHENTDILLVDEAHRFLTDKTTEALGNVINDAVPFGLSASLGARSDGADALLEAIFGPIVFELGWVEAIANSVVVPIKVVWHRVRSCDTSLDGLFDTKLQRAAIWCNSVRNRTIAAVARKVPADEQTLIFVATTEHAANLAALLPDYELCYGTYEADKFAKYVAQGLLPADHVRLDKAYRAKLRKGFMDGSVKKVIATDVWSTGVSFNNLANLIRADGRVSEVLAEQIPGRASRISEGKSCGIVHDFDDSFSGWSEFRTQKRRASYKSRSWVQSWADDEEPERGR